MTLATPRAGRVKKIEGIGWTFLCRECRQGRRCASQSEAIKVALSHCLKVDHNAVAGS